MRTERELLNRVVVPFLTQEAAKLGFAFELVDPRGELSTETSEGGSGLQTRLRAIDGCHPYMIVLLGESVGPALTKMELQSRGISSGPEYLSRTHVELWHARAKAGSHIQVLIRHPESPPSPDPDSITTIPAHRDAKFGALTLLKLWLADQVDSMRDRRFIILQYGVNELPAELALPSCSDFESAFVAAFWDCLSHYLVQAASTAGTAPLQISYSPSAPLLPELFEFISPSAVSASIDHWLDPQRDQDLVCDLEIVSMQNDNEEASDNNDSESLAILDENVQFTVFRPSVIAPETWHSLPVYAHLAEKPPNAPTAELDPVDDVAERARGLLGERIREYEPKRHDSHIAIPRYGEISFVLEFDGLRIDSRRKSFEWTGAVHEEVFRFMAPVELLGRTVRGRISVFLGAILVTDIALVMSVQRLQITGTNGPAQGVTVSPYRKIFASYSHMDSPIVEQFEVYSRGLGDEYVRDWRHLRAGQNWSVELQRLIREADVFQLFWSANSMRSDYCRQEWEYALSLERPHFVRPTFWQMPMPTNASPRLPSGDLLQLHFQFIGDDRDVVRPAPAALPPLRGKGVTAVTRTGMQIQERVLDSPISEKQAPKIVLPPMFVAPEPTELTATLLPKENTLQGAPLPSISPRENLPPELAPMRIRAIRRVLLRIVVVMTAVLFVLRIFWGLM